MPINILTCGWKFPSETVYVIGTGPKGKDHYLRIPFDAWTIGVNKAILLQGEGGTSHSPDITERMRVAKASVGVPCIPLSIWLCADITLPKQKWFTDVADTVIACDFQLNNNLNPTAIFSTSPSKDVALTAVYPHVHYYFEHGHTLRERPEFTPEEGVLRAGGSISGQAIQLAYWLGAKEILLIGVDMTGSGYFDETENINPRLLPDGTSKHLRMMNGLCAWMKGRGVRVASLSETALDVEVI